MTTDFHLVASGGGALGLTEAAAIEELLKKGVRFTRAGGASAGAINAARVAFGAGGQDLSGLWTRMLTSGKLEDWRYPGPLRPLGALHPPFGMLKGAAIRKALEEQFGDARMGDSPIPLRIVVSNLYAARSEVVDSTNEKHKRVRVVDGLMCSAAVPLVIPAQRLTPEDETLYTDGGMVRNAPAAIWDDADDAPTLTLRFNDRTKVVKVDEVREFVVSLFRLTRQAAEDEVSAKPKSATIILPVMGESLKFTQTPDACAKLRAGGTLAARVWLATRPQLKGS